MVVWPEVVVNLLGAREAGTEATDDYYRELQTLCLVDRHNLYVSPGERLIRILVLVDAAVVEQT